MRPTQHTGEHMCRAYDTRMCMRVCHLREIPFCAHIIYPSLRVFNQGRSDEYIRETPSEYLSFRVRRNQGTEIPITTVKSPVPGILKYYSHNFLSRISDVERHFLHRLSIFRERRGWEGEKGDARDNVSVLNVRL